MASFEIKWQAPEFEYREKGVSWYWISIILAVIILGAAVWQKNFLFGLFVVVAEILLLAWANREPNLTSFTISEKGLSVGGQKFYALTDVESFSCEENNDSDWLNLFFQFRRRLKPPLKIRLPKKQFAEIRSALKTVLPQVEYQQSLLDTLEELIGF